MASASARPRASTRSRTRTGVGWFEVDYLGIDQGPIALMAENHRSGLVWEVMRKSPYMVRGLCRAGFRGGWLDGRCTTETDPAENGRTEEVR